MVSDSQDRLLAPSYQISTLEPPLKRKMKDFILIFSIIKDFSDLVLGKLIRPQPTGVFSLNATRIWH